MCVVITYLAVFSQAWIDADWIFMFSFRRKLLILEKNSTFAVVHYLLIHFKDSLKSYYVPGSKKSKARKKLSSFFLRPMKTAERSYYAGLGCYEKGTWASHSKSPQKVYPRTKIHSLLWKNWGIFMGEMSDTISGLTELILF